MKLIIDIPEDVYTRLFDNGIQDNEIVVDDVCEMARALRLGTPLDDVKAEIKMVMDMYKGCEYIGDKARRDELWHVLEILDNIGKAESEDT